MTNSFSSGAYGVTLLFSVVVGRFLRLIAIISWAHFASRCRINDRLTDTHLSFCSFAFFFSCSSFQRLSSIARCVFSFGVFFQPRQFSTAAEEPDRLSPLFLLLQPSSPPSWAFYNSYQPTRRIDIAFRLCGPASFWAAPPYCLWWRSNRFPAASRGCNRPLGPPQLTLAAASGRASVEARAARRRVGRRFSLSVDLCAPSGYSRYAVLSTTAASVRLCVCVYRRPTTLK